MFLLWVTDSKTPSSQHPLADGYMTNLHEYWIGNSCVTSSYAINTKIRIDPEYKVRANDTRYLTGNVFEMQDRLRQFRLKHNMSRPMFATVIGAKAKVVGYYEDRKDAHGEHVPIEYLKNIAILFGEPEYLLCNQYLIFIDRYSRDFDEWIKNNFKTIKEAQEYFGVKECALMSWRKNKTQIPYSAYLCILKKGWN